MTPVEWLFTKMAGSRPVPGACGAFLVAYHPHRGGAVCLPDGTVVHQGDPVAELHFWNRHIAERSGRDAHAITWRLVRDIRADLRVLARVVLAGEFAAGAVAVYGASPVAAGAERLGFTVLPLRAGWRRSLLSFWQLTVRRVFRPAGVHAELQATTMEAWLSRRRLLELYGPGRANRASRVARPSDPGGGHEDRRMGH